MHVKKAMAAVLACLMAFSGLSGCSKSSPAVVSGSSGSSGSSSSSAPAEKTTVVVWNQIFEDWNQKFFKQAALDYNKQSANYIVKQQFIAGAAWTQKMKAAQASNTAPDTYVMAYNAIPASAQQGTIMALNDLLPQSSWDDLYDNVKTFISYKGKYYAYPQLLEPSALLYYRKDLFTQAGIGEAPKTWADLLADAKKLTTKNVFGLEIQGFGDAWAFWGWEQQAAGHQAITDDWSKANCTDQGFVDLADFFRDLYKSKAVPQQPLAGYTDILPYGKGEVAMQIDGSWAIAELKNTYPAMVSKTSVVPVPTQDGDATKATATMGGWSYVIDAHSKNAKGAANYLYWLLAGDPKEPAGFFKVAQYSKAAPRKSIDAIIQQDPSAKNDPWVKTVAEVAKTAIPEPIFLYDIQTTIANAFQKVATGGVDANKALGDAATAIQKLIDSSKLAGTNPRAQS